MNDFYGVSLCVGVGLVSWGLVYAFSEALAGRAYSVVMSAWTLVMLLAASYTVGCLLISAARYMGWWSR